MVTRRAFLKSTVAGCLLVGTNGCSLGKAKQAIRPNIVFILADDQGYGDVSSFNSDSKIPTPGIDGLAKAGMRFTDAHSASAVCTPTRYGILTGRYPWRSRLQRGVLQTGAKPLISQDIPTVQKMLKGQGYKTACIGKWHLGFEHGFPPGKEMIKKPKNSTAAPVGSSVIGGPTNLGFDTFYGYHHAGEMGTWIAQETVTENIESIEMLPYICSASVDYITERAAKDDGPFFLYVPFNSPHGPIVPSKDWQGKSGLNAYGDFVMQTDDAVAQIVKAIDAGGLADNTLIIFTTDNGCSPIAKFKELLAKGHDPSGGLRGHKADVWDGGHRVPYVARWVGKIKAASTCDELVCHNSLLATCAELLDVNLADNAAVDSFSIAPLLRGQVPTKPTHPYVIHASINGHFAIRQDNWKFIACKGSGGWSKGSDGLDSQLYDMASDRPEADNLVKANPAKAAELLELLEQAIAAGRTTAGPKQSNDVPVNLWKTRKTTKVKKAPGTRQKA